MKIFLYLAQLSLAIPLNVIAIIFAPVICLTMNNETGKLPYLLNWFQPTDTYYKGVIGGCYDHLWIGEHPHWSLYKCAWTFIARNPAYGFNEFCNPHLPADTATKVYGNIDIADGLSGLAGWYLITTARGYWNFSFVWKIPFTSGCVRGDYGWNFKPLAVGYKHTAEGMLLVTMPVRFYSFNQVGK